MLGNDDALATPDVLTRLKAELTALELPEICLTNFQDWDSGAITRRINRTSILGNGPAAATHYFRSFSFTSGLIFDRVAAARHETDRWDRSIYYQIYLACRILASGGRLGGVDLVAVLDNIRLNGELVPETYRVKYRNAPLAFGAKHTGLDSVARVTIDAIRPYVAEAQASKMVRHVYMQLLTITYPYWLFEYRQLANWGMGFGVARDLWPAKQLAEYRLGLVDRAAIWLCYLGVTAFGLLFPAAIFNRVRHHVAAFVRRRRQRFIQ
ncbi:MAG: hypothetical protein M3R58_01025 [Pseudomonadota bacterium]|nr:hypothetical protein [Pseudomonadota bacterium]